MEISNLKIKDKNKVIVSDSLKAPIFKMSIKLNKDTVIPTNNNLIIYVKQEENIKEITYSLESPLSFVNNISDEFIITPSFNGEKIELKAKVKRLNSQVEELNYKGVILFEGYNEIYTNYENATLEISYPKDTEMVYYFLSNVMSTKNTGETNSFDIDKVYPVGSIYMSMNDTNPNTLFGGYWNQIASGRTLVGVDTTQAEFNTVKKTGGSKYLQKHNHKVSSINDNSPAIYPNWGNLTGWGVTEKYVSGTGGTWYTADGGSGNAGNLQPYVTCYIWERID